MTTPYQEVSRARRSRMSEATKRQGKVLARDYGLAGQVIAARKSLGWTQTDLATKTGMSQGDISNIERGVVSPTEKTLVRLAEALGSEWRLVPQSTVRRGPEPARRVAASTRAS